MLARREGIDGSHFGGLGASLLLSLSIFFWFTTKYSDYLWGRDNERLARKQRGYWGAGNDLDLDIFFNVCVGYTGVTLKTHQVVYLWFVHLLYECYTSIKSLHKVKKYNYKSKKVTLLDDKLEGNLDYYLTPGHIREAKWFIKSWRWRESGWSAGISHPHHEWMEMGTSSSPWTGW